MSNIINSALAKKASNKLLAIKKVSRGAEEKDWITVFSYIHGLNQLDEFATQFQNRSLENIEISPLLEKFVIPSKVSIDITNRLSIDLIDREGNSDLSDVPSYHDFITSCERIYASMKLDLPNGKTAMELRKGKNFAEVLQQASFKGHVNWDGKQVFIPIPIKLNVFKDAYLNTKVDEVVTEWLTQMANQFK